MAPAECSSSASSERTEVDVAELRARSYEDLARVAERRSDQKSVIAWLEKAKRARAVP